jgi:hypothetical protein
MSRPERVRTSAHRTFRPGEEDREHLQGIDLPDNHDEDGARIYVARILAAASEYRGIYASDDPEVDLLRRVGPKHANVLVEALVLFPQARGPSLYVIEALKSIARDEHKQFIIDSMAASAVTQHLVDVIVAKGWTTDAAAILLSVVAERSPHMTPTTAWVEAAARVARPENYADLRFQLVNGPDAYRVWKAIHELPGMAPLDALVAETWQLRTRESSHEGRRFALVAARYGHKDALGVLVEDLARGDSAWWETFQELTGFGVGRTDPSREEDAQEWFAVHKEGLAFDPTRKRYTLRGGG